MHFKELFALDGKPTDFTENDQARRNTISGLLEEWELLTIVSRELVTENVASLHQIKILSYTEKDDWELIPKYNIGKGRIQ